MRLLLQQQQTSQPQQALQVDPRYLPGLDSVFVPAWSKNELLSGIAPSTLGTHKIQPVAGSVGGVGVGANVTASGIRYPYTKTNGKSAAAWLIVAHRNSNAPTGTESAVRQDGVLTPVQELDFGAVRMVLWDGGGLRSINYSTATADFFGKTNVFTGRLSANSAVISLNGASSSGSGLTGNLDVSSNPFCLGANEGGGEVASDWTILLCAIWSGPSAPSVSTLRALSENPWQLFERPNPRRYWLQAANASSFTADAWHILRKTQTTQPQQAVGIDWGNPITRGLVNAWHFAAGSSAGARDVVGSANGTPTSTSQPVTQEGWLFSSGGVYLDFGQSAGRMSGNFSVAAVVKPNSTTGGKGIASVGTSGWYLRSNGTQWNVIKSQVADIVSGGTVTIGKTSAVGFSFSVGSPNSIALFADGLLAGSTTTAQDIRTPSGSTPLLMGVDITANSGETWQGSISALFIFNRALSDAEMRSLTANPWQVFKRANTRRWSLSVVSVGPPYYPSADVSAGGWTASNGGTLASCIDEATTPNDADYISSGMATGAAIVSIGPLTAGSWSIKVRSAVSTGTGTLTAKLRDSGSVLDTQTTGVTTTPTTYTLNFTVGSTADRISFEVA